MYQALYRKWRPKTFDQVVGQEHITETLKNQVKTGRLSHAYLFIGTRGTGKTTCAKILAKAVNCENPVNGNPCGKCPACLGIEDASVMDVVELDAASNNGVDNVRALRDEAVFSPASVKKRVYIIDEVHMLSTSAFNALLKILEEPPEHLMFILATTELNKVPATILSRCQRHSFKRLDTGLITKHLQYVAGEEKFDLAPDAAELIARLSEGGMRDALSLLDQCSGAEHITVDSVYSAMGLAGNRSTAQMLDNIASHDSAAALELFQGMWRDGKDPAVMLGELNALQRDVLMISVAPKSGAELTSGGYDSRTLKEFSKKLTPAELTVQMSAVQDALFTMRTAGNPKTAAELCLISLCEPSLSDGLPELRARVSRLENAVSTGTAVCAPPQTAPDNEPRPEPMPEPEAEPAPEPVTEPAAEVPDDAPPWDEEPPEPRSCEAADDDGGNIDPGEFAEFQPEDDFLDKGSVPVQAPLSSGGDWAAIANRAESMLPPGLRIWVSDPTQLTGELNADSLHLYANPLLAYGQLNNPNVLNTFRQAAGDVLGRPISVTIGESSGGSAAVTRDIEELKKFKEVHFTGGN